MVIGVPLFFEVGVVHDQNLVHHGDHLCRCAGWLRSYC